MKIGAKPGIPLLKFFLLPVIISLIATFGSNAQKPISGQESREAPELAFVACYELSLGRWWPWSFGGDTIFVTPPRRIRLLPSRGTTGFEKDQLLIRPLSDIKGATGRGGPSYWQAKSDKQVDLVWNDGFTGVTLSLEKQGDELRGWAHPHFDAVPLIPRTERVIARKIVCPLSD